MNLLIMCAPSNKQSDVNTMGAVLDTWVTSTQGVDANTRSRRPPGLLVVTTMWDLKLQPSANETPEILEVMADNVVHLVLERFKSLDWIGNWDGKPFNNLFLVRKPGVPGILFAQENGREVGIAAAQAARMGKIRGYYMASREIARHVREPGPAWEAMLAPNDGGVGRVIDYLKRAADPNTSISASPSRSRPWPPISSSCFRSITAAMPAPMSKSRSSARRRSSRR